jgi:integrase
MSRAPELTARAVADLTAPGRHRVAKNLFLLNRPPRKSWLFIYTSPLTGHVREMGLGAFPDIGVPAAKATAERYRAMLHDNRCPLVERRGLKTPRPVPFSEAAAEHIRARQTLWRSAEHRRHWKVSLQTHAAALWDLPVATVDTEAVLAALKPEWEQKPATMGRVRGRIEQVLDYAKVRGWRNGPNPAIWRGHLDKLLPSPKRLKPVRHHAALPWSQAPDLWRELASRTDMPALVLRLLLLTATRRGELLRAKWDEIDRGQAVWTISANHTKAGREHRVPLSAPALAILDILAPLRRSDLLFPGVNHGRPIAATSLRNLMLELRPGTTLHGFRACFRTWCAEATNVRQDIAEAAMGHVVENQVIAAYQRGDLLALRAELMANWAQYLTSTAED